MKLKGYFFMIFSLVSLLGTASLGYTEEATNKLIKYGIDELDKVEMFYRHEGGHSATRYAEVKVKGDGNTTCSFQYHNQPEQTYRINLERPFIEDLIKLYAKLDFFEFEPQDITDSFVIDAGQTTLSFQFKDQQKSINYAAIKTKTKGRLAVPATPEAEVLAELQSMFWKILSQQDYLYRLKDYQDIDYGELADLLSSLEADVRQKRVLNAEEFLPVIMEIISQNELRESVGQYAATLLEQITEYSPPGDWWDCKRWIKWWQEGGRTNINQDSDIPFVVKQLRDYTEFHPNTGKTDLKIEAVLNVYQKGKYRLNGFLLGATAKDESGEEITVYDGKDINLLGGQQVVVFTFDGQRIFEGKFSSYKFYLNTEGFEKTLQLSSTYDYRDFRQTKAEVEDKDKDKDFSEIASELVLRSGLAFGEHLPYAQKLSLENVFGRGVDSSYFVFEVDTTKGLIPSQAYAAVAKDKTHSFIIQDFESFNDLITSINFTPRQDNDYIKITQLFLEIMPQWNVPPQILWQIPEPDKTWGSGGSTFKDWFRKHDNYRFHQPIVKRQDDVLNIEYYTWEDNAGILKKQYFKLSLNGTVIEHNSEKLGERIGNYVII